MRANLEIKKIVVVIFRWLVTICLLESFPNGPVPAALPRRMRIDFDFVDDGQKAAQEKRRNRSRRVERGERTEIRKRESPRAEIRITRTAAARQRCEVRREAREEKEGILAEGD